MPATGRAQPPTLIFYNAEQGRVLMRKGRNDPDPMLYISDYYIRESWQWWRVDPVNGGANSLWWRVYCRHSVGNNDYLTVTDPLPGSLPRYKVELRPRTAADETQHWNLQTVQHHQAPGNDLPPLPDYVRLLNRATGALLTPVIIRRQVDVRQPLVATSNLQEGRHSSWLPVVLP